VGPTDKANSLTDEVKTSKAKIHGFLKKIKMDCFLREVSCYSFHKDLWSGNEIPKFLVTRLTVTQTKVLVLRPCRFCSLLLFNVSTAETTEVCNFVKKMIHKVTELKDGLNATEHGQDT
jgi:hypothetical protein